MLIRKKSQVLLVYALINQKEWGQTKLFHLLYVLGTYYPAHYHENFYFYFSQARDIYTIFIYVYNREYIKRKYNDHLNRTSQN